MNAIENQIKEQAKKLLEDGSVNVVIGYAMGSLPLRTVPIHIRFVQDIEKLVWNRYCTNNLANYILRLKEGEKVAIIAKACDARNIIGLIKENQLKREDVKIIGISCSGMISYEKIEEELKGDEITSFSINEDKMQVNNKTLNIQDYLYDNCKSCHYPNPPIYDILAGEEIRPNPVLDEYQEINDISAKSSDERWQFFANETKKCLRCYACRNSCPLCYCQDCFVDQSQPSWFGKSVDSSDTSIYHIIRAFHSAGRCVDCGACERACPMQIKLRFLTKRIEKEVKDRFDFTPGLDLETMPPLTTFELNDKEDFMIPE